MNNKIIKRNNIILGKYTLKDKLFFKKATGERKSPNSEYESITAKKNSEKNYSIKSMLTLHNRLKWRELYITK